MESAGLPGAGISVYRSSLPRTKQELRRRFLPTAACYTGTSGDEFENKMKVIKIGVEMVRIKEGQM